MAHLDHSSESGGAELALLRLVTASAPWSPTVVIPRSRLNDAGVFSSLGAHPRVGLEQIGPRQAPGASNAAAGLPARVRFAAAILAQSLALRSSRIFRRSDVVHANTTRAGVYGAFACVGSRKRFVVHLRDMVAIESLGNMGFQLFSRIALRRADGVIANSHATLASAQPYLRQGTRTAVIPSPLGLTARDPYERTAAQVRRVGMVARIDHWKGQDILLRAFARRCAGTDIRLVYIGGTSFGKEQSLEELRVLADTLGVADQVDFLGHVDDVTAQIKKLDVCVQASTRPEPLGQNVLQYLAAGKPVIAVDAGGPAEWIRDGENGLLTAMGDIGALDDALHSLITDASLRERLAAAAHATPGIRTDTQIAALHGDFFRTPLS